METIQKRIERVVSIATSIYRVGAFVIGALSLQKTRRLPSIRALQVPSTTRPAARTRRRHKYYLQVHSICIEAGEFSTLTVKGQINLTVSI